MILLIIATIIVKKSDKNCQNHTKKAIPYWHDPFWALVVEMNLPDILLKQFGQFIERVPSVFGPHFTPIGRVAVSLVLE